ncbi:MAG: glycosyltransferase [Clostridiales bacterium]|nr:glycosyltransferase [Clostridiales bacterium]
MQEKQQTRCLVSVIVPVYNAEKTIESCIGSILNQTYRELEVLAVDDGSTDQSLALLRAMEAADGRMRVFSQANSGVAAARNLAINQARGVYLQFVDSDDFVPAQATQRMVEAMEAQGCDMALAPYTEVIGSIRQKRGFLSQDMVLDQRQFLGKLSEHPNSFFYSVLWNKLYRRDIIVRNSIRCDGRLPWGEDFAFNTEYYRWAACVAVLSEPVYEYIRNPMGLALSTSRQCVIHPWYNMKVKVWLYRYYVRLYEQVGLYEEYKHVLPQYLFKVTINN